MNGPTKITLNNLEIGKYYSKNGIVQGVLQAKNGQMLTFIDNNGTIVEKMFNPNDMFIEEKFQLKPGEIFNAPDYLGGKRMKRKSKKSKKRKSKKSKKRYSRKYR
jgi:hypothetical protein